MYQSIFIQMYIRIIAKLCRKISVFFEWIDTKQNQNEISKCSLAWYIKTNIFSSAYKFAVLKIKTFIWFKLFRIQENHRPNNWILRIYRSWWRHQVETFSALLALCAGNSPVTRSFDVFFDMRLNKRLGKQSWGWWSETPSSPLWRHCNVYSQATQSALTNKSTNRYWVAISKKCFLLHWRHMFIVVFYRHMSTMSKPLLWL